MEGREKITWVSRLCGYPPICNSQHSQSIYCIVQLLQYKTREIRYYSLLSSQEHTAGSKIKFSAFYAPHEHTEYQLILNCHK